MSTLRDILLGCLPFVGFIAFGKLVVVLIVTSIKVRLNDSSEFKTYIKKIKITLTSIEVEFEPQSPSSDSTHNSDSS